MSPCMHYMETCCLNLQCISTNTKVHSPVIHFGIFVMVSNSKLISGGTMQGLNQQGHHDDQPASI